MRPTALVPALAVAALSLTAAAALLAIPALFEDRARTRQPAPAITPAELPAIVMNEDALPRGMFIYELVAGEEALRASGAVRAVPPGFVDALLTRFDTDHEHEGDHEDRSATLGAVFLSDVHAANAFGLAAAHHEAQDGWAMRTATDRTLAGAIDVGRGDEWVHFTRGSDYGYPALSVYLSRVGNVVLHAVDFHPYDRDRHFLRLLAHAMSERAAAAAAEPAAD